MSAAEDCVNDARNAVARARHAMERGSLNVAFIDLCTAHRFHALGVGLFQGKAGDLPGVVEVDLLIRDLQRDLIASVDWRNR